MKGVSTDNAPTAFGPYSQAIDTGSLVFCSGQIGVNPATKKLPEGIEAQTDQALRNLQAVLAAAGLRMTDVVKTTMWLTNTSDFETVNAAYARYFEDPAPARSAPIVVALPFPGALISIEAIAVRPSANS
jgi:2-iminobutanoate/2-iminopropanoate deaminase